ncbi:MAG: Smr/MutS family protein [Rhodobacteraceae bacterium]|nr:Smr/MutS family protein [Paracoccaceae bacterium]
MARRKLTSEEIDLWRKVAARADRMHPEDHKLARVMPKPKPTKTPSLRFDRFEVGQVVRRPPVPNSLKPSMADRLVTDPVQMDRKAFGRMKRGKLRPEGRIDLHGMTLERAHPTLTRFILSAQASGKRLVLVITGKGRQSADHNIMSSPRGILRSQLPHWLSSPPLAQAVMQVSEAHVSHGGGGAYYVYLRKGR